MKTKMKTVFAVVAVALMVMAAFVPAFASFSEEEMSEGTTSEEMKVTVATTISVEGVEIETVQEGYFVQFTINYSYDGVTKSITKKLTSESVADNWKTEIKEYTSLLDYVEIKVNTTDAMIDNEYNMLYKQSIGSWKQNNIEMSLDDKTVDAKLYSNTVTLNATLKSKGGADVAPYTATINGPVLSAYNAAGTFRIMLELGKKYNLSASAAGMTFKLNDYYPAITDEEIVLTSDSYVLSGTMLVPYDGTIGFSASESGKSSTVSSIGKAYNGYNAFYASIKYVKAPENATDYGSTDLKISLPSSLGKIGATNAIPAKFSEDVTSVSLDECLDGQTILTGVRLNLDSNTGPSVTPDKVEAKYTIKEDGKDDVVKSAYTWTCKDNGLSYLAYPKPAKNTQTHIWTDGSLTATLKGYSEIPGVDPENNAPIIVNDVCKVDFEAPTNDEVVAKKAKITVSNAYDNLGNPISSGIEYSTDVSFYMPRGGSLTVSFGEEYDPSTFTVDKVYGEVTIPKATKRPMTTLYGQVLANGVPITGDNLTGAKISLHLWCDGKLWETDGTTPAAVDLEGTFESKTDYYKVNLSTVLATKDWPSGKVYEVSVCADDTKTTLGFYFDPYVRYPVTIEKGMIGHVADINAGEGLFTVNVAAERAIGFDVGDSNGTGTYKTENIPLSNVTVRLEVWAYDDEDDKLIEPVAYLGETTTIAGVAIFSAALYPEAFNFDGLGVGNFVYVVSALGINDTSYGQLTFADIIKKDDGTHTDVPAASEQHFAIEYITVDELANLKEKKYYLEPAMGDDATPGFLTFAEPKVWSDTPVEGDYDAVALKPLETLFTGYYTANGQALLNFGGTYTAYTGTAVIDSQTKEVTIEGKQIFSSGKFGVMNTQIGSMYVIPIVIPVEESNEPGNATVEKAVFFDLFPNDLRLFADIGDSAKQLSLCNTSTIKSLTMDAEFIQLYVSNDPWLSMGSVDFNLLGTVDAPEILQDLPAVIGDVLEYLARNFYTVTVDGAELPESFYVPAEKKVVVTRLTEKMSIPLANLAAEVTTSSGTEIVIEAATQYADLAIYLHLDFIKAIDADGNVKDVTGGGDFVMKNDTRLVAGVTIGYEPAAGPQSNGLDPTVLTIGIIAVVIALIAVAFVAFMSYKKD